MNELCGGEESGQGKARWALEAFGAQAALVLLLAALAYANAPDCDFVWDDVPAIRENPLLRDPGRIPTLFRTQYWTAETGTSLYRPLLMTSFALDRWWFGPEARGFHVMNVAWHAAACLALLALFRRLAGRGLVPLAAALLFAAHPVHAEAVTGLVGRSDVQAALFAFLSLLCYERQREATGLRAAAWIVAGAASFLLGLLCKEAAVVAPGLALLLEWRHRQPGGEAGGVPAPGETSRRILTALAAHVLALITYLVARHAVVGTVGVRMTVFEDAGTDPLSRVLLMSRVLSDYVRMMVLPIGLTGSYSLNTRPDLLTVPIGDVGSWAAVAFLLTLATAALRARTRQPAFAVGVGWFFLSLAPVSNLVFPIGALKAERFLYLPSAGAALALGAALAAGIGRLRSRERSTGSALLGTALLPAVLTCAVAATLIRNFAWTSPEAFWEDVLAKEPGNPSGYVGRGFNRLEAGEAHQLLGQAAEAEAALGEAVTAFREAIRLNPALQQARIFEGEALRVRARVDAERGRHASARALYGEALAAFERACRPKQQVDALLHRAFTRLEVAKLDPAERARQETEARRDFEDALAVRPDSSRVLSGLAFLACRQGRFEEALECAGRALALQPDDLQALYLRGRALVALGAQEEALRVLDRLLTLEGGHAGGRHQRGLARLRGGGDARAAAADLREAARLDPGEEEVFEDLAKALRACGDEPGAQSAERAAAARPTPRGEGGK
ncbi:MAG: tetratricopeptide repeat protein [Planctomycetes bacterium]|nr:tetratricopeptide repeat protein [Planctomycetota bacterium]